MLYYIVIASIIGGVCALIGGVALLYWEAWARRISILFVSFAIGSLLGAAFFELLPEAIEATSVRIALFTAPLGFFTLFLIERFLRFYHCHDRETCDLHVFSSAVIIGDTIHNFLDGIAIAASFLVGVPIGIVTTIAVFLHEIPQEIGDFAVLLHAGYSRLRVLLYNVGSALAATIGAVMGYFFLPFFSGWLGYILSFTAGVFIYIAASDLVPEVHHRTKVRDFGSVFMIILGFVLVYGVGVLIPE